MPLPLSPNAPHYQAITIPANSGAGVTLRSLLTLPAFNSGVLQVTILGKVSDGTQRAAFRVTSPRPGAALAAGDWTTHARNVGAGEDFFVPGPGGLDAYIRSDSASTVTAIVELL